MMRTGWEWDLAIPTRSVGGVVWRVGVIVLGALLGRETLGEVIINVVVRYFWMWSFFAFRRLWRWGGGFATNRRGKEPGGDGEFL